MIYLQLFLVFCLVTFLTYFTLNTQFKETTIKKIDIASSNVQRIIPKKTEEIILPKLTLDRIFGNDHQLPLNLDQAKLITILATGDVIPARSVNFNVTNKKNFLWPYEKTAHFLQSADLTFVNLETPLIKNCPLTQEGMIFCGDSGNIEGLVFAGVDVVSLGNNHAGNYGIKGVKETIENLTTKGIDVTGVNGALIKQVKGIKFAFLGYNDIGSHAGVSNFEKEKLKREIELVKQSADVVIVTYHWGTEYRALPDERQIALGHLTIDLGADLVIGNHPHWIQPVEIYKEKLITYAHGNFVFDQMWSRETEEGVVGKYTFYGKQLIDVEYFPVSIADFGQPDFMTEPRRQEILDNMMQGSLQLTAN